MGYLFTTAKEVQSTTQQQSRDSCHNYLYHHSSPTYLRCSFLSSLIRFFIVIFFTMLSTAATTVITLNESGVRPVKPGDTAMVFYANVSHTGREGDPPILARLFMERCCLLLPPNRTNDCELMKLISGNGVVFHPNNTHVLQMYFVNFDLFDREGSCVIRLLSKSLASTDYQQMVWDRGSEITIPFSTVLPKPSLFNKLFISLGASSRGFRICDSDNHNALHECSNFNDCLIRYAGGRSLFNKASKECEPTPNCEENENRFLSIVTKKCAKTHDIEHVRNSFTYGMVHVVPTTIINSIPVPDHPHHLSSLIVKINNIATQSPDIVCEHGERVTGKNGRPNCTCHSGWRSLTIREWQEKGGVISREDDGLPFHRMCNVPLASQKTRVLIFVAFFAIGVTIAFISMLIMNQGCRKRIRKKKTPDSDLSSSGDEDEERQKLKNKVSNRSVNNMQEEEADKVIMEIANRREPKLPKKIAEKNDDVDNTLSSPSIEKTSFDSSRLQEEKSPLTRKKSDWLIPWKSAEKLKQKSDPPSRNFSTSKFQPTFPSESVSPLLSTESKQFNYNYPPSGGFEYSEMKEDNSTEQIGSDLCTRRIAATQTTSTDDLLTLKKEENLGAHVPIKPSAAKEKGVTVSVADCSTVELNENNVTLRSLSSEEITRKKKEEWAEFIKSVSGEKLNLRRGHCSISLESRKHASIDGDKNDNDEDKNDNDEVDQCMRLPSDFSYFHKDRDSKVMKTQSVPGMMQYRFSCTSTPQSEGLPEPPPQSIQKAFAKMTPDELASRQECYQVLSSLSKERLSSKNDELYFSNSIWSNIASENTNDPCITPATTIKGSFVPPNEVDVADEDDSTDLRLTTIYGDIGSDNDSNGALEKMAKPSSPLSTLYCAQDAARQPLIHQPVGEINMNLYETPQLNSPMTISRQPIENVNEGGTVNPFLLESDLIPSDAYNSDSTSSSRLASHSGSSTNFWNLVTTFSLGGTARQSGNNNARETKAESLLVTPQSSAEMSTETASAYKIKSSLETALKASRSRSGTNFF